MGMLCILLDHAENVRKCLAVSFCVCFPSVNITKFNVPTFYYYTLNVRSRGKQLVLFSQES